MQYAATEFAQDTVTTDPSQGHGGTIGLQSDGTSLFSLFEAAPNADGSIDTQIRKLPSPGATPVVVYATNPYAERLGGKIGQTPTDAPRVGKRLGPLTRTFPSPRGESNS